MALPARLVTMSGRTRKCPHGIDRTDNFPGAVTKIPMPFSIVMVVLFVLSYSCKACASSDSETHLVGTNGRIIPIPSAPQLRYQSTDFVALIHFNMATYARDGDPGCDASNWNQQAPNATGPTSDPRTFFPTKLNTTQWFDSITALGAKIAVLTAKHGCGFLLWPTNATLPPNAAKRDAQTLPEVVPSRRLGSLHQAAAPYGYHTNFDLLQDFVDSAKAAGVGYGFYYSIMKNFFLCRSFAGTNSCTDSVLDGQHNVTDEDYHAIVKSHLTELWTNYGDLAEVWIDSRLEGFGDLLDRLQPRAGGTPANPRDWCGTESGHPSRDVGPGPVWQTGRGFFGDPSATRWVDKFCDPQLFEDHVWFYEPGRKVKSLEEMIPVYHDIVGRGMVMELAFAINREGLVEASHERVYQQLGDWVRACYGTPVASRQDAVGDYVLELPLPPNGFVDRIVLEEDVAVGQRIRNYTLTLVVHEDESPTLVSTLVSNGTSVGRKRIHLLEASHSVSVTASHPSVLLNITGAIGPPRLKMFGLYQPCFPELPG